MRGKLSREREREKERENLRECLTLSVVYPMKLVCSTRSPSIKNRTILQTLNTSPFLPLKWRQKSPQNDEREEEEEHRRERERRTRRRENQPRFGGFGSFCCNFEEEKDGRRTQNGEATHPPSGEGAEKEGKVGERTEEEERRFSTIRTRRRLSYNGARVANASGSLGCRLRHARLLPRGVSIANVVV